MKIKLAVLEKDINYLNRIVSVFTGKFSDKLEVYSFTDMDVAFSNLERNRVDILLASDAFVIEKDQLPHNCGFAYFVDSLEIESFRNEKTICKFQKAELIYKEILGIYSEMAENTIGLRADGSMNAKIITFASAGGGTGSSTVAAACAMSLAARGKKVLYLNLEQFGDAGVYLSGQGQYGLSDAIYAIKSRKSNLALKLESSVKKDDCGVYYYDAVQSPLDITELTEEDYNNLFGELMKAEYSHIVLDIDFSLEKKCLAHLKRSYDIILVSDGSEGSNLKLKRALKAVAALDQFSDKSLSGRISVMFNKFSSKYGKMLDGNEVSIIGGIPKYEQATTHQLLKTLSKLPVFEKID